MSESQKSLKPAVSSNRYHKEIRSGLEPARLGGLSQDPETKLYWLTLNNFEKLETIFEKLESHFEKLEKQKVAQH